MAAEHVHQVICRWDVKARGQRRVLVFFSEKKRRCVWHNPADSRQQSHLAQPQQPLAPGNFGDDVRHSCRFHNSPRRNVSAMCSPARAEIAMIVSVGS